MDHEQGVHWRAPTTIVVSLICGILLTIGHHLFYSSLSRHKAPNDFYNILGSNFSNQQLNIAGGTAFALLVKEFLSKALSTVYAQLFWHAAQAQSSHETSLGALDTTSGGLTDIVSLVKVWTWKRHPLMFVLAIITWLIPLASVVTPATLSVVSAQRTRVVSQHVPNINFKNLNYVANMPPGEVQGTLQMPTQFVYAGPSKAVETTVEAVMAQGSIASITPPGLNTSWSISFPGPSLECTHMLPPLREQVRQNIAQRFFDEQVCAAYGYLAWSGVANQINASLPFQKVTNETWQLKSAPLDAGELVIAADSHVRGPEALYMVTMPHAMTVIPFGDHSENEACNFWASNLSQSPSYLFTNATMIQCQVLNSTYRVAFDYNDGTQNVAIRTKALATGLMTPIEWVFGPATSASAKSYDGGPDCSVLNQAGAKVPSENFQDDPNRTPCRFNETLLATLSYQAISQAFNERIVGSAQSYQGASGATLDTSVVNTVLTDTRELHYLTQSIEGSDAYSPSLQAGSRTTNGTMYEGLYNDLNAPMEPLIDTLQKLFEKSVVSMIASSTLQPNATSAFSPGPVDVTYRRSENVYIYSAVKLWIAYGVAILFALTFSIIGLTMILATRSSYSQSFSTVFRIARGAVVSAEVKEKDMDGRDPLPSYLSRAKVRLHKGAGDAQIVGKEKGMAPSVLSSRAGQARMNSLPRITTAHTL